MPRYADLEGTDAIDTVGSEETLLANRTSMLAAVEYTSLTIETALSPASQEGSTPAISDTDTLAGGLYEVEGELEGFGSTIATLNDYTYGEPVVATENMESETVLGTWGLSGTIAIVNDYTYSGPLVADRYPENETLLGTDGDDVIDGGDERLQCLLHEQEDRHDIGRRQRDVDRPRPVMASEAVSSDHR